MTAIRRYAAYANEDPADPAGTLRAAQIAIDVATSTLDTPRDTELLYEGGLSRGVTTRRGGFYQPSGNTNQASEFVSLPRFLRWALGGYAYTAGSPNRHEAYAAESLLLPPFSSFIGKDDVGGGDFEHAFAGCAVNTLTMEADSGYLMVTLDVLAVKDSKGTLKTPAEIKALLPAKTFRAFHDVTWTIGGGDESCKVNRWRLNIANSLDGPAGRGSGSRFACRIPAGGRAVTFEADLWYADTANVERVWGGASGPGDSATDFQVSVDIAGEGGESAQLKMDSCHLTAAPLQPTGRTRITHTVTGTALVAAHTLNDASTVETEILATVLSDVGDVSVIGALA